MTDTTLTTGESRAVVARNQAIPVGIAMVSTDQTIGMAELARAVTVRKRRTICGYDRRGGESAV